MRVAITTVDNPFNPFNQFVEWFEFDRSLGYNSSSLLARIVVSSSELPENLQQEAINLGIDQIIAESPLGVFRKVTIED